MSISYAVIRQSAPAKLILKMEFCFKSLIAIGLLVTLSYVQSYGNFFVLRNSRTNDDRNIQLTCISEDSESALIWNTNEIGQQDFYNEAAFEPKPSVQRINFELCAISNSTTCLTKWQRSQKWQIANSAMTPMGPALDYRWEDFEELVGNRDLNEERYQSVGKVSGPIGTAVFSAPGPRNVHILICDNENAQKGFCFWIIIAGYEGKKSILRRCPRGAPSDRIPPAPGLCPDMTSATHDANEIINEDEWRTFTIKWDVDEKRIQIFRESSTRIEQIPFLEGKTTEWRTLSHVFLRCDRRTRVRFHFYDYYITKSANALMRTDSFSYDDENSCLNVLVGIHPRCRLDFHLMNKETKKLILLKTIRGTNNSLVYNGTMIWQSVRLNFPTNMTSRNVHLIIRSIGGGDEVDVGWAIDNFRTCNSNKIPRKSTILTTDRETKVYCQKLSYNESTLVDGFSENLITSHTQESQKYIQQLEDLCGTSCLNLGDESSLCDSSGCTCSAGFRGNDCNETCSRDTYGFNCNRKCACCPNQGCDNINETCQAGFYSDDRQSIFCNNVTSDPLNSQRNNLLWMISIPIVAICLLPVVIWRIGSKFSNRARPRARPPSYLDVISHSATTIHSNNSMSRYSADTYVMPNEPVSCTVSIQHFKEHVKQAAASGLLYSQFTLLRSGMIKPCEIGTLPENIPKNRSGNLIPYDDTRVVLDKIPGDPHSDYINASYIRGYRKERAYIATQGPKPNTINDFWRMIWQEDVRVICMMSNVVEGVTNHSEKYWPDCGTRTKYGNFFISNTNQQVFAEFTLRTFDLSCDYDTREVTHLQYTGWPVLGMPCIQPFVAYLKKLAQIPRGDGPIVVHCHTGDGRSGVIILCDISLRQVIEEGMIDVMAVTIRMRDSRAKMVATPQEYLFAHIAIEESLMSIPTQLPCTEICSNSLQIMRLRLPVDLERLEDSLWQEQALDTFATQAPSTAEYATIDDITLDISGVANYDNSQPCDRRRSAIDVVSVDGLKLKNQYLASWLPPPLTLANFWKFVVEENIQLIVILQCSDLKNTTCSDIIPDGLILPSMPDMTVEPKTVPQKGEYFTSETLLLRDTSERLIRSRTVTVLTCGGWQTGEYGKPPAPVALVSLWRASEKIPRKEAETLVLCHNGTSACGLYLAMCLLLERMAVEGECDVISAVRKVRESNPGFNLSKNHCEYLYDAAEIYAEDFKCYANFT